MRNAVWETSPEYRFSPKLARPSSTYSVTVEGSAAFSRSLSTSWGKGQSMFHILRFLYLEDHELDASVAGIKLLGR